MSRSTATLAAATVLALAASLPSTAATSTSSLSKDEVLAAQQAWCEALVQISQTHAREGQAAAAALAEQVLDSAYGYNLGPVLFKPTLTVAPQTFRTTREGALAYFVGGNPEFPQDSGFALKGWTACEAENAAVKINGNMALTMGNVRITNGDGQVTTVDKTWSFLRDAQGSLRIVLHHSSLPHAGA